MLLITDYCLRIQGIRFFWGHGIPALVGAGVTLMLGCLSVYLLWHAVKKRGNRVLGILEIVGHAIAGFVLWFVILLVYAVSIGGG